MYPTIVHVTQQQGKYICIYRHGFSPPSLHGLSPRCIDTSHPLCASPSIQESPPPLAPTQASSSTYHLSMGFQSGDDASFDSSITRNKRSSDLVCYRSYGTEESQCPPSQFRDGDDHTVPPPDHGIAAWLFLFGCFWLDGLAWGGFFCFRAVAALVC